MQLLFIRHAEAEPQRSAPQRSDIERRLTPRGQQNFRRTLNRLKRRMRVDLIASSPLQRARQTAAILQRAFPVEVQWVSALAPQQPPARLWAWLRRQPPQINIALIGHEPELGRHIGWLLARRRRAFVELARGGICALRFDAVPVAGHAQLLWLDNTAQ